MRYSLHQCSFVKRSFRNTHCNHYFLSFTGDSSAGNITFYTLYIFYTLFFKQDHNGYTKKITEDDFFVIACISLCLGFTKHQREKIDLNEIWNHSIISAHVDGIISALVFDCESIFLGILTAIIFSFVYTQLIRR